MHGFPLLAVAISGGRGHCVFLALSLHWAPSVTVSFHPALRPLVVVARVFVGVGVHGGLCVVLHVAPRVSGICL